MTDAAWVFTLALLYNVGKAGAHATRITTTRSRVDGRAPLIQGFALSDLYHGFSGIQWPLVLWVCWAHFGTDLRWWVACAVAWGLIWPASKWLKGLGLREALAEAWYVQIAVIVVSRVRRWHRV